MLSQHFYLDFTAINYCPDYEDPKSPLLAPSDSRFNLINYVNHIFHSLILLFNITKYCAML